MTVVRSISLCLSALENFKIGRATHRVKIHRLWRETVRCEKIFIKADRIMAEKTDRLSIRMRMTDGDSAGPPEGLDIQLAGSIAIPL